MISIARKTKCKGENCEKLLEPEEKQILNGKAYCVECYLPLYEQKRQEKENIKQKKEQTESQVKNQYKQLISTICEYFNIKSPTGLMIKQIKQYKEEYGYTDAGIGYTLWYLKEIENKRFDDEKYGIALVKYHYDNAKRYYEQQEKSRKSVENIDVSEHVRVVNVRIDENKNSKYKFTLDLDGLIGGDR